MATVEEEAALTRSAETARTFPAYRALKWKPTAVDLQERSISGVFEPADEFTHGGGMISGSFVAAMLDCVLSAALGAMQAERQPFVTTSLTVNFIGSVSPGTVNAIGNVVRRGRAVAFTSGELRTPDGQLAATATATARFVSSS